MMSRSFHYRNKSTWIKLYKTYVCPHLEYAAACWNPWTKKDIETLENVQRRAVKMCTNVKANEYKDKLQELILESLEQRRKKFDLIQTWKILHRHDNVKEETWFQRAYEGATRNTSSKMNLKSKEGKLDIRRNFYTIRVEKMWNKLPEHVKSEKEIYCFIKHLPEFG